MSATTQSTVVGHLEIRTLDSFALRQSRKLRVWLPPDYAQDPSANFDVLYMHDGQNLFDVATSPFGHEWQIDETLTKLIADKNIPPLIVIGIDNSPTNRIGEYTYKADPKRGGGQGAIYTRFLLEEVMPLIEKTYRIKTGADHTYLGGSSLGGLISLEIARRNPGIFGGVMAMSPSIWWPGDPIVDSLKADAKPLSHTRVWIDMGSAEEDDLAENLRSIARLKRLDSILTDAHVDHRMMVDAGARHNEDAWSKRFPKAIEYLMNGK